MQEKLPDGEVFILTPTLRSDNGKTTLTVYQLTIHLPSVTIKYSQS